jgi:hypothetical protein
VGGFYERVEKFWMKRSAKNFREERLKNQNCAKVDLDCDDERLRREFKISLIMTI